MSQDFFSIMEVNKKGFHDFHTHTACQVGYIGLIFFKLNVSVKKNKIK